MKKLFFIIIIIIFQIVSLSKNPENVKVVVTPGYVPYVIQDDNGELSGISIDLWKVWERITKIKVQFVPTSLHEGLEMIKNKQADIIDCVFFNEQRAKYLDYGKAYDQIDTIIFFKKGIEGISGIQSLKGFKVGVVKADFAETYLRERGINDLITIDDNELLIKEVTKGKINVFIADEPTAFYHMNKYGIIDGFKHTNYVYNNKLWRAVKKGNSELLNLMDSGFDMISTEEFNRIMLYWKGKTSPINDYKKLISELVILAIVILIIILLWIYTLRKAVSIKTKQISDNNQEINLKNQQLKILSDNYEEIINIMAGLFSNSQLDKELFFQKLLETSLKIVSEADYGTISVVDGEHWKFLAAVGHNKEELNNLNLLKKYMVKPEKAEIIEDLKKYSRSFLPKDIAFQFDLATKSYKSTMIIPLKINDDFIGNIALDIADTSSKRFSEESIKTMKALSSMSCAYFTMEKYFVIKENFQKDLIMSMIRILEIFDKYSKGHSLRVAELCVKILKELGGNEEDLHSIYWSGLVHDIGKIFVPEKILNKQDKLNDEEYEIIKQHPIFGQEILSNSTQLRDIASIIFHHHERFDGKGYPYHLKGDEIPLHSRIIFLADSYEAMISERAYRNAMSKNDALKEIINNSGTQFDPIVVNAFIQVIK